MTKQARRWKGHCRLPCGREMGNSTRKGTSTAKHLRKIGIARRAQNVRARLVRSLDAS